MPRTVNRRSFLRAAGVSVALPTLSSLQGRLAEAAPARKMLFVYMPCGIAPDAWYPAPGTPPSGFKLSPCLTPLGPHLSDVVVFGGVDLPVSSAIHGYSMSKLLTNGGRDSLDQLIGRQAGSSYRFATLELGVRAENNRVASARLSYKDGKAIPPQNDPRAAFQRLFSAPAAGGTGAESGAIVALHAERQSVLDAVRVELQSVMKELGRQDRVVLDQHLQAVRDVEKSLAPPQIVATADCRGGAAPVDRSAPLAAVGRAQMELIVLALQCGLTPVATLLWNSSSSMETFPQLGVTTGHHTLSHDCGGRADNAPGQAFVKVTTWYVEQFAHLIKRLGETRDGMGTLLDSTTAVLTTDFGTPHNHSYKNVPFVLAGRCGGAFKTGRYVEVRPGTPVGQLLAPLGAAMGVNLPWGRLPGL